MKRASLFFLLCTVSCMAATASYQGQFSNEASEPEDVEYVLPAMEAEPRNQWPQNPRIPGGLTFWLRCRAALIGLHACGGEIRHWWFTNKNQPISQCCCKAVLVGDSCFHKTFYYRMVFPQLRTQCLAAAAPAQSPAGDEAEAPPAPSPSGDDAEAPGPSGDEAEAPEPSPSGDDAEAPGPSGDDAKAPGPSGDDAEAPGPSPSGDKGETPPAPSPAGDDAEAPGPSGDEAEAPPAPCKGGKAAPPAPSTGAEAAPAPAPAPSPGA